MRQDRNVCAQRRGVAGAAALLVSVVALAVAGCTGGTAPSPGATTPSAESTLAHAYEQYVALGDSYTSAPGVPDQQPGPCKQSTSNYPHLLAARLGADLVDRSCGSAAIKDLTDPQYADVPPQLDALTPETDLVTLSIGANPTAFLTLITQCIGLQDADPQGAPCKRALTTSDGDVVIDGVEAQRPALTAAVERIRTLAPEARIVLVGYPSVFPEEGSCPDRLPLAVGDVAYANTVIRALNSELEAVAEATGSDYLDIHTPTAGHDMCAEDPWIQGAVSEPGVALLFHPRIAEQRAVAELLVDLLR